MATIASRLTSFSNALLKSASSTLAGFQQVRNGYVGRWMIRDIKRRKLCEKHAPERLRLVALKRNDILPKEIRDLAEKQIQETIPRQTALRQLTNRCVLTSRGRGVVMRWRVSRIMFRHLVDYNKLAGMQRAMW